MPSTDTEHTPFLAKSGYCRDCVGDKGQGSTFASLLTILINLRNIQETLDADYNGRDIFSQIHEELQKLSGAELDEGA